MNYRMQQARSKARWSGFVVTLLASATFVTPLFGRLATPLAQRGKRIWDTKFLDINRWHLPFYNDGRFAIDITKQNFPGGYWPAPIKNYYLFGGGLWVGAITKENETLVTVGYNPNSGGGEFYPTISSKAALGAVSPHDRIYKYGSNDWPPNRDYFKVSELDTLLIPRDNFSLQDMWMAFTDCYAAQHTAPGKPLGLDVFLTVYAWNYPANQDIFFCTYKVKNSTARIPEGAGPDTLRNVYFGVCNDNDIGDATDDMVGAIKDRWFNDNRDHVQNVGFVGDFDNHEAVGDKWQGGTPGVCAMKFLESPRRGHGDTTQLGMTAFKKFTIDIDPPTNATQYKTMAGIDYQTDIYSPFDSIDETKQDKRIIQCSGPFELAPESVATIVVAIFAAPFGRENQTWGDRIRDPNAFADIVRAAVSAQFIYDRGWLLPGPPESPHVTLVPGDNRVRITWDNHSEVTPARYYRVASDTNSQGWDPLYREYDFQGYKVWKSSNGADWKLLTQCDLVDGDTFRDTTQAESIRTWPAETGIFYSFVDDSVTNGFTYYYAVSAYCHNKTALTWTPETESLRPPHKIPKDTGDIFLEGGKKGVAIVPRADPVNIDTALAVVRRVVGDTTRPALVCSTVVTVPFKVSASDTYLLHLLKPQYSTTTKARYRWCVTRLKDGSLALDTFGTTYDLSANARFKNDLP
ncbi:MAG: hypothetical protein ABIK62_02185, partial [candidate division WOR-3 bacterium]